MKDKISLYVHIPFCMSKCSYCSFISRGATKDEIEEYFKFLNVQIIAESAMVKDRTVATIYFGGGTPSFVDEKYIVQTMNTLRQYYNIDKDAEITIECNPCSVTVNKLKAYKRVGVNRISFGVQSLNDDCLKIIGRKHNRLIALDAIKTAQKIGFVNISADLLIGIPNQTQNMLIKDIKTLSNLGIKHISAYMLMLEKGTKLYEQVFIDNTLNVANDEECVNMYNCAYSLLKQLNFKRYEISNFAISGYECKHNINYWDMGEYLGFGVAAHSYINGYRIEGFNRFDDYYKFVREKYILRIRPSIMTKSEKLSNEQKIEEYIMLSLRQSKGINLHTLKDLGYDLINEKSDTINTLKRHQIIDYNKDNLYITESNFGASNQIILELLP